MAQQLAHRAAWIHHAVRQSQRELRYRIVEAQLLPVHQARQLERREHLVPGAEIEAGRGRDRPLAGGILEASVQIKGTPLDLSDFHIAWFIVAVIAAISALSFLRLPPDAGANVSGHRVQGLPKAEVAA